MHSIPEKGNEVLIDFHGGNAEMPLVIGCLYNGEQKSEYGTPDNDIKAFKTRSGVKVEINDAQGSILIEDPSGNTYLMDGQGNIKVNAPENMDFTAGKNVSISAGKDISIQAGKDISEVAGNDINQSAAGNFTEIANSKSEFIDTEFYRASENSTEVGGTVAISSTSDNVEIRSATTTQMNSAEKSNLF